jgi:hypothetical protein
MSNLKSMPNTFRRIGGRYNHYFDPNDFLGQMPSKTFGILEITQILW